MLPQRMDHHAHQPALFQQPPLTFKLPGVPLPPPSTMLHSQALLRPFPLMHPPLPGALPALMETPTYAPLLPQTPAIITESSVVPPFKQWVALQPDRYPRE